MKNGSPSLFLFMYSLCAGLCLMSFALLLHPMSPEDFLLLSLVSPQVTLQSAYGIQAAAMFWISTIPTAIGMAGLLYRIACVVRRMTATFRCTDDAAIMREGWSY